ncbi:hypothetical protein NA57DRAFT_79145 [Rhizodiscina lignyota]|uniref:Uncharacterized protein n=1 Tax=Rhizodiscina lignyota TaxID=1504668 RepID=A0A9P4I8H7_9PEZI|nr:hypothetical protein NA57DRAFT_79145 [Rhizodiscina lignyota]
MDQKLERTRVLREALNALAKEVGQDELASILNLASRTPKPKYLSYSVTSQELQLYDRIQDYFYTHPPGPNESGYPALLQAIDHVRNAAQSPELAEIRRMLGNLRRSVEKCAELQGKKDNKSNETKSTPLSLCWLLAVLAVTFAGVAGLKAVFRN